MGWTLTNVKETKTKHTRNKLVVGWKLDQVLGFFVCIIYTSVLNSCAESFISKIMDITKMDRTSNIEQHSLGKIMLSTWADR